MKLGNTKANGPTINVLDENDLSQKLTAGVKYLKILSHRIISKVNYPSSIILSKQHVI